jgi:hypothetical protein
MIGGEKFPAPQATLMATMIKGLFSANLDWQFVLVGAFVAVTMELCGVKSLSFAVGLYLPLSTTLPIFIGGLIRGLSDWLTRRKKSKVEDSELSKGSLFATGLVAGGTIAGVLIAFFDVYVDRFNPAPQAPSAATVAPDQAASTEDTPAVDQDKTGNPVKDWLTDRSLENWWLKKWPAQENKAHPEQDLATLTKRAENSFNLLGVACFAFMGLVLFFYSRRE